MPKSCVTPQMLLAYAREQLDPSQRAAVEAHLEACSLCCVRLSEITDPIDAPSIFSEPVTSTTVTDPQGLACGHPAYDLYLQCAQSNSVATKPTSIGRYRIERILGSGGFGIVYLATDEKLERKVAIKVPHSKLFDQPQYLDLILQEAKTAAKLDHPHIVPIYDVGSSEDFPVYLVTKLIDGQHLAARQCHGLTEAQAVQWSIEIADALAYAHRQGVMHRDVKPLNVLIDAQDHACLTDFGLAARLHEGGISSIRAGTPAYMSPEQLAGSSSLDQRTDIYSLGRILTELLMASMAVDSWRIRPLDALDKLRAAGRDELAAICQRACADEANARYGNATEFATALRDYAIRQNWNLSAPDSKISTLRPFSDRSTRASKTSSRSSKVNRGLAVAAAAMTICLLMYSWHLAAASQEDTNLESFLQSPSKASFDKLRKLSQRSIDTLWTVAASKDPHQQLTAKIALMKVQPDLAGEVIPTLLTTNHQLAPLLLSAYPEREKDIKDNSLTAIHNRQLPAECRLKVAAILAKHFAQDELWSSDETVSAVSHAWIEAGPDVRKTFLGDLHPFSFLITPHLKNSVRQIENKEAAEAIGILTAWQQLADGNLAQQVDCLVEGSIPLAHGSIDKLKAYGKLKEELHRVLNGTILVPGDPSNPSIYRAKCMAAYCLLLLGEPDEFWKLAVHRDVPDLETRWAEFCDESSQTLMLLAERLLKDDMLRPLRQSPHQSEQLLFSAELSTRRQLLQALFKSSKWTFLPREPFDEIISRMRILVTEDADPGMQAIASRILKGITPIEKWIGSPWLPREQSSNEASDRSWSINSLNMVFVHIEHAKELDHSFCLGQCEVDSRTFQLFLKESGYAWVVPNSSPNNDNPSLLLGPQNFVTWYDCAAFCNWLSRREGLVECYAAAAGDAYGEGMIIKPDALVLNGYRLPTSEEWEIGCRAGAKTPYATGYHCSVNSNWVVCSASHPQPVGIYPPNSLGLFDMHGNVSEWVLHDPKIKPFGQPMDSRSASLCRGGDFANAPSHTSCDHREVHPLTDRQATIGFRVARTIVP